MRRDNFKKILLSLIVIGLLASLATASTFASFTAQTDNPNNTFSTGTLVLSNTRTGGSTCYSTGGGSTDSNSNAGCDTLISASVKKPGDAATQTLKIQNSGSLDASALKLFSPGCTDANNAEAYHGTGSACGKVQLYIQQYSDAAFTTPLACLYGGAVVANTCDFSDTTKTLGSFAGAYGSSGAALSLGSLAAGNTVFVKVGMMLPNSADNSFQGRKATIDFSWQIIQ
jgi:predicted ribosomally synthesized peptide with SipW-like signal peptide